MSRSSGSGSGMPSLSRQISAVSSRSPRAERIALNTGARSLMSAAPASAVSTVTNASRSLCRMLGIRLNSSRISCWRARPSASSLAPASPRFFDFARFWKPFCSWRRTMRSSLARKLSRSGRSTEILRKPKRVVGKTWLTVRSSSLPSLATTRVSPSRHPARSFRTSAAFPGGISRRLSPRLRRMGDQNAVASMSCTIPSRFGALRLVRSHT